MMRGFVILFGPMPFLILAIVTLGLALAPAILVFQTMSPTINELNQWAQLPLLGILAAFSYYVYGFSLIFVAPTINLLLGGKLKPWRGPAPSLRSLSFYRHATLTLITRYTFLEFITPSAFNVLFYRLMGMKCGHGVTINSTAICDPSLIELGDQAMIGGSASIMGHYAQGNFMVIAPVKIGPRATIGLRAVIMGGVEVGEKAKVLANSFVLPNTRIPAGETWAGIPAAKIELSKSEDRETAC
jgi:acetyltransferase-like isoleucine patch superfamily enzyme